MGKKKTPKEKPPLRGGLGGAVTTFAPDSPDKPSVVETLTKLLVKHGPSLPEWLGYHEILLSVGLTPAQVTKDVLRDAQDAADAIVRKQCAAASPAAPSTTPSRYGPLQFLREGSYFESEGTGKIGIVEKVYPDCSVKVRVVRPKEAAGTSEWSLNAPVRRLSQEEVDALAIRSVQQPKPESAAAGDNGSDARTHICEGDVMKVYQSAAVELLTALGLKSAGKLALPVLAKKLVALPKALKDADRDKLDDDLKALLDDLVKDVEAKKEVKVVADEVEETPPPKNKAASGGKKDRSDKPKANGKVERDKFGQKVGSQCNRINEVLTKKPQPLADIVAAARAPTSATSSHLRTLMTKGHVVRTDEGYALKK